MRLEAIGHPDGRLVHFTCGTTSGSDANHLNRLDPIQADSGSSSGTTLPLYTYLGVEGAGTEELWS
jgi:hypothetical protein